MAETEKLAYWLVDNAEAAFPFPGELDDLIAEDIANAVASSDWLFEHDRAVAEKAWDEGHRVGWEHCQDGSCGTDWWDDGTPNPYRKEVE